MNAYQPLAEQQNLFLFVATGGGALYALPQYLAELAILVAVYGSSRRLGFEVRAAACGAFLLATFSLVALEAIDGRERPRRRLVPGGRRLPAPRRRPARAGAGRCGRRTRSRGEAHDRAGRCRVLVWLALARGRADARRRRSSAASSDSPRSACGATCSTSSTPDTCSGSAPGQLQDRAPPSYPRSVANAFYLMYGTMDLSVLSNRLIDVLALAGLLAAAAAAAWALRRAGLRRALGDAARVATPFLAPLLVLGGAGVAGVRRPLVGLPDPRPGRNPRAARQQPQRGLHALRQRGLLRLRPARASSRCSRRSRSRSGPTWRAGSTRGSSRSPPRFPVFLILISLHARVGPVPHPLLPRARRPRRTAPGTAVPGPGDDRRLPRRRSADGRVDDHPRPVKTARQRLRSPLEPDASSRRSTSNFDVVPCGHASGLRRRSCRPTPASVRCSARRALLPPLRGRSPAPRRLPLRRRRGQARRPRRPLLRRHQHRSRQAGSAASFGAAGWRIRSLAGYWLLASRRDARAGACTA